MSSTANEHHFNKELEDEIRSDEQRMEDYGGDDPEEPPEKTPVNSPVVKPAGPPMPWMKPHDPNRVEWDGPDDPANPQNWGKPYRWAITLLCGLMTVNVTFASSAPAEYTLEIVEDLGASTELGYLITSIFLCGYVVGPIFWGPLSELLGRRQVFVWTLSVYTLFHIGQALAQNIETLIITRFFCGVFACAPLSNAGGLIADVWDPITRGLAMSLFSTTVSLGPVLGPIIAGFMVQAHVSWRWIFWVMMMFAGTCTVLTIIFLPETYAPVLHKWKAQRLRKEDSEKNKDLYAESERGDWSAKGLFDRTIKRPFVMLLVEPILLLITLYMSIVYGVLYALFEALPIIYMETRGLTVSQGGLTFIAVGIGTTIGAMLNIYLSRMYPRLMRESRGFPLAEYRLYSAMVGAPAFAIGAFWLAWSGHYASVPWYVPALSTIFIGMSFSMIFISFLSYVVDTYLMYAASALSANTIIRSAVAAGFPLFTVQMIHGMGINWALSLVAFIALACTPMPFLFFKYGPRIRQGSKFAPCIDLKIKAAIEAEKAAEKATGAEKV
ncbi:unnamed protein product [Peniophora sp. CBMAI 1063]|nr:unnamed protein product [Peniophora sp. CBMAI 1063]